MFHRFLLFVCLSLVCFSLSAQIPSALLKSLESEDWRTRGKALVELKAYLPSQAAKDAIMSLLIRENQEAFPADEFFKRPDFKPAGEANSEQYVDLLNTVASFRDERSATVLAGAAGTGAIVSRALAQFPRAVLPVLIDQMLANPSTNLRIGSAWDLAALMLDREARSKLQSAEIERAKSAFLQLSKDPMWLLRRDAVRGLQAVGDTSVLSLLRNLAENDPHQKVREAALKAVSQMQPQ